MEIIRSLKIPSIILAATVSASFGLVFPAVAQAGSYLVDLNSKTVAELGFSASGINGAGQVVGTGGVGGYDHAFISGPNGMGMRDIGTLNGGVHSNANGVNDAGQVVGTSFGGGVHAFITGPDGVGMRDLGAFGYGSSYANAINELGQVVGRYDTGSDQSGQHAFITGPNGMGMRDLGTLGGTGPYLGFSEAKGINSAGRVVGRSFTAEGAGHAFITGSDGTGMRDLGTLGGTFSDAHAINEVGEVVGRSYTAEGALHAFITGSDGMGMRDLGTLGGTDSYAHDVNNAGQVVGYFNTLAGPSHAFITGPNGTGITDLNSLVHVPGGGIFTEARGINDAGQVIAIGGIPAVVPEPESYALLLAGLALIGFIARQKKMREAAFSLG
jgi:probable HAF family extracellular repeat protein